MRAAPLILSASLVLAGPPLAETPPTPKTFLEREFAQDAVQMFGMLRLVEEAALCHLASDETLSVAAIGVSAAVDNAAAEMAARARNRDQFLAFARDESLWSHENAVEHVEVPPSADTCESVAADPKFQRLRSMIAP